jgi:hypothetical protein
VQLVDGTEWRIKATTTGPYIVPIIKARTGLVATSGHWGGRRCYGINGKHFGFVLVPLGPIRLLGQVAWLMRRHEDESRHDRHRSCHPHERTDPDRRRADGLRADRPRHPR